jgi:2-oxoisovalerate dehydrogenase E1 component
MVKDLQVLINIKPDKIKLPEIPLFQYKLLLQQEINEQKISRRNCIELLEQMLMIRVFEEMIAEIVGGVYEPLPKFKYIGPTHISIGQEATSTGAVYALNMNDYITSSHRGHGDAIAKGYSVIKNMSDDLLKQMLLNKEKYLVAIGENVQGKNSREELEEKAIRVHIYRMIAELFGREDGYCRGVGGSMHIADFENGHLGANAIVGGHIGIAVGAAISNRYFNNEKIVLCLAGDGAYSNGIAAESLNIASMAQFTNGIMNKRFGVPIIFGIVNNQYAMTGQESGEITGIDYLARRAAGYNFDALHAEVVDGMDVLAVYDATKRAAGFLRSGKGPALLEYMTYRYKGHSLSDPLKYRSREELSFWQERDPIKLFTEKISKTQFPVEQGGSISQDEIKELRTKVWRRNSEMAFRAASAKDPAPETLLKHMYVMSSSENVPKQYTNPAVLKPFTGYQRNETGEISYRFACREAMLEEMARDSRIIMFGEDIAEHGGAFGVTNEILEIMGRDRVFNTSISESGIVGTAVGMAMTGLRPIAEIMYNDFILQAMDQIGNQAAKWHYMSGGQIKVPLVLRTTIGGGKGYAGQHAQSLESIVTHIPGLLVVAPSDAYDAKGLLKSAIRDDNPVIFFEHQLLYNTNGVVPEEEYTLPIGKALVKREGRDVTFASWSYMVNEAMKAASMLETNGISAEVIDLRTLVPLDIDTIILSIEKTSHLVIFSQPVEQGSYAAYIAYQVQKKAFDYLDAPIICVCAPDGVPPTSQTLEREFMPNAEKLLKAIFENFNLKINNIINR